MEHLRLTTSGRLRHLKRIDRFNITELPHRRSINGQIVAEFLLRVLKKMGRSKKTVCVSPKLNYLLVSITRFLYHRRTGRDILRDAPAPVICQASSKISMRTRNSRVFTHMDCRFVDKKFCHKSGDEKPRLFWYRKFVDSRLFYK